MNIALAQSLAVPYAIKMSRRLFGSAIAAIRRNGGSCWPIQDSLGLVYGPELVVNGDFSNGTTGWNFDAGWAVVGGVAVKSGSSGANIVQPGLIQLNKTYLVEYTVTITAGAVFAYAGNGWGTARSSSGTFSQHLISTSGTDFGLATDGAFRGSVSHVSVREVISASLYQDTAGTLPVTTQGQVIGLSLDQASNGVNLTQSTGANKPTLTRLAYGKQPYAYQFDGSNDTLTFTPPAITTAATLGWAGTISNVSATPVLFSQPSGGVVIYINSGGGVVASKQGGAGFGSANGTVVSNAPVVITVQISVGGTSIVRVNGVQVASSAAIVSALTETLVYLGATGFSNYLSGQMLEPMIENSVIPLADLKAWERNACNQLGITYAG